jgi:hypothetical protein
MINRTFKNQPGLDKPGIDDRKLPARSELTLWIPRSIMLSENNFDQTVGSQTRNAILPVVDIPSQVPHADVFKSAAARMRLS